MTDSSNQNSAAAPLAGEALRVTLAELIGVSPSEVEDDANLVQLGLGSLEMMRLVTKWRRAGLAVSFGELTDTPTFAAWNERITRELAEATA
ncbi:phosphopantetheine-binding protein [Kitasatospora purpeofusca]|uniref:phosphopantetheine-binding protein n=1 Tax=Kitasatospora purpeofusca TaxID=67352 RepID=UPI0004C1A0C5|nr:phosphopantetheine-binding protein [Kitasatospora purpeofusca]